MLLFAAIRLGAQDQVGIRLLIVRTDAEAAAVSTRIQAGERFEDLARTQSFDRSAAAGGYIGASVPSQLRPEFQTALTALRPGQVSSAFKLGAQFAFIQLLTDEETRSAEIKAKETSSKPSPRNLQQLWAAAISDPAKVRELLAAGNSANVAYDDGSTVLMGAVL